MRVCDFLANGSGVERSGPWRERRGGQGGGTRPEIGFQIGLGRGKHKTDILSDVKLFRVFCLKLAGVVFGDLALPMK